MFNVLLKKIIYVILMSTIILNLFSCKGIEFENQKIAIAEELKVGEVMIFVAEEKNKYENRFGNPIWDLKSGDGTVFFKDYVVYTVKKFIENIMMLKLVANDLNIIVTAQDEEKLRAASDEYMELLSASDLMFINCDATDVYNAFRDYHISRLAIDNLTKSATTELSVSEAKVIKTQYIVFGDRELAYKTAEDVTAKGANFAYFAKTRSEDTEIDMTLKRGDENSTKFPELFYLSSGQISNVLQYRNKYYLFKCIEDYNEEETEERRLEILKAMKNEEYIEKIKPYEEKYNIKSNSSYWRSIDLSLGNDCKIDKFEDVYYKYFQKTIK